MMQTGKPTNNENITWLSPISGPNVCSIHSLLTGFYGFDHPMQCMVQELKTQAQTIHTTITAAQMLNKNIQYKSATQQPVPNVLEPGQ